METRPNELIRDSNRLNGSITDPNLPENANTSIDSVSAISLNSKTTNNPSKNTKSIDYNCNQLVTSNTASGSTDHNYSTGSSVDTNSDQSQLNNKLSEDNGRAKKRLKCLPENQLIQKSIDLNVHDSNTTTIVTSCIQSSTTNNQTNTPIIGNNSLSGPSSPIANKKSNTKTRARESPNRVYGNSQLINNSASVAIVSSVMHNSPAIVDTGSSAKMTADTDFKSSNLCSNQNNMVNNSKNLNSAGQMSNSAENDQNKNNFDNNNVNRILNPIISQDSNISSKESVSNINVSPKVPPLKIVIGNTNDRLSISNANLVTIKKAEEKNNFFVINQSLNLNSSLQNTTNSCSSDTSSTNNAATNLAVYNGKLLDAEVRTTNASSNVLNVNLVTNPAISQNTSSPLVNSSVSSAEPTSVSQQTNQPTFTSSGRVTRSSQRAAAVQSGYAGNSSNNGSGDDQSNGEHTGGKELRKRKNRTRGTNATLTSKTERNRLSEPNSDQNINQTDVQPSAEEDNESSSSSSAGSINGIAHNMDKRMYQMPTYNCYHKYLNIRKQVDMRRSQQLHSVQLKPPQNINQFLVTTGDYLLQQNSPKNTVNANPLPIDMGEIEIPPTLVNNVLKDLYCEQELDRRRLRLQHHIEKEKLRLSAEQEILRVHSRAALANSNPILPPLSVCSILKDQEIYNSIEPEVDNENESEPANSNCETEVQTEEIVKKCDKELDAATESQEVPKNSVKPDSVDLLKTDEVALSMYQDRDSVYNVLQDIHEKWLQIKKGILLRQKRESESLQAIQKLNWQWKDKELNFSDIKSSGKIYIDERYVPLVLVQDFELLPNL